LNHFAHPQVESEEFEVLGDKKERTVKPNKTKTPPRKRPFVRPSREAVALIASIAVVVVVASKV
jgi:hypothetical protein